VGSDIRLNEIFFGKESKKRGALCPI